MQGRIISEQILLDAKEQSDKILSTAQMRVDKEKADYQEFKRKEKEQNDSRLSKRLEALRAEFAQKRDAELQKSQYKKQQSTLHDLKLETKKAFLSLSKAQKLHFVESILSKYSEKGEQVLVKIDGISLDNVKALKVVKQNELVVTECYDDGIILSSDMADKNFLLSTLIDEALQKCEGDIYRLLF